MASDEKITFLWVHQNVKPSDEYEEYQTYLLAYRAVKKDKNRGKPTRFIQVRSDGHSTTKIKGVVMPDPNGCHWTISHKGDLEIEEACHLTVHAYTKHRKDFKLKKMLPGGRKRDDLLKEDNGKPYWPEVGLHFGAEIAVPELEEQLT